MIHSEFEDYYDKTAEEYGLDYQRNNKASWRKELTLLKEMGVEVVECDLVYNMRNIEDDKLVVFIGNEHNEKENKKIVSKSNALEYYNNFLCSPYIPNDGNVYTYLRIGSRQFSITSKIDTDNEMASKKDVVAIKELDRNYEIGLESPIYSIDYLKNGESFIAIGCNLAKKLDGLIQLKKEDIVEEIIWYLNKTEKRI